MTEMLSPSFVAAAIAGSERRLSLRKTDAEAAAVLRVLQGFNFSDLFGDACKFVFGSCGQFRCFLLGRTGRIACATYTS